MWKADGITKNRRKPAKSKPCIHAGFCQRVYMLRIERRPCYSKCYDCKKWGGHAGRRRCASEGGPKGVSHPGPCGFGGYGPSHTGFDESGWVSFPTIRSGSSGTGPGYTGRVPLPMTTLGRCLMKSAPDFFSRSSTIGHLLVCSDLRPGRLSRQAALPPRIVTAISSVSSYMSATAV